MAIADNLAKIIESIETETSRAGRPAGSVRLVAVSKTRSHSEVEEALRAGQTCFGENRVQEALDKFQDIVPQAELHLIGHLQGNKVRAAAGRFALIHSVDSVKLAAALSKFSSDSGLTQKILIQVNTSLEDSKSGFLSFDELEQAALKMLRLPSLEIRGLMTMGPLTDDPKFSAAAFALCREWHERLARECPGKIGGELSMGMSSDYQWAIHEGATMVRIGTALFGERSYAV